MITATRLDCFIHVFLESASIYRDLVGAGVEQRPSRFGSNSSHRPSRAWLMEPARNLAAALPEVHENRHLIQQSRPNLVPVDAISVTTSIAIRVVVFVAVLAGCLGSQFQIVP
jgi:hypothetical protein